MVSKCTSLRLNMRLNCISSLRCQNAIIMLRVFRIVGYDEYCICSRGGE